MQVHQSFALGLDGVWERNFQAYLSSTSSAIKGALWARSKRSSVEKNWQSQKQLFFDLRGIVFDELPMAETLNLLRLVAHVARHGNGPSCRLLATERPVLFREKDHRSGLAAYFAFAGRDHFDAENLMVPSNLLYAFAEAIRDFWLWIDLQSN